MADYSPKAPIARATTLGLQAAAVGTMVSALRNALGTHTQGAMGVLTRTGGTIGLFAAVGATYAVTESTIANVREKDDPINSAVGACAAAFLAGIRTRSLPVAVTGCAVMGAVVGGFDFFGRLSPPSDETVADRRKKFFKHPPNFSVDPTSES